MEKLKADLDNLINRLKNSDEFIEQLETLISIYPFNEYEYIIATLMAANILSLEDYYELRDEYIARNLYLYLFEIVAPRSFGETWGQGHLKELVPDLLKPSRKLDVTYSGQYDFLLEHETQKIRIEIKASRAVDFDSHEPLYIKALLTTSLKKFDMNFQQLKPKHCDVFIWIGVWRDKLRYWVLAAKEVENNKYYSVGQHRGNVGEGQLHLKDNNILEFTSFEVRPTNLYPAIVSAYQRQISE